MAEVGGGSAHGSRLSNDFVVISTIALPSTTDGDVITNQTNTSENRSPSAVPLQSDDDSVEADYIDVVAECDECDAARRMTGLRASSEAPPILKEELHVASMEAWKAGQTHLQAAQRRSVPEPRVLEEEDREGTNRPRAECSYRPEDDDGDRDDVVSDKSDSSSDIAAEVETYFQQECDAFVIHERLMELEFERKETQAARDQDSCLVDELGAEWQEFEPVYKRKRQELCEALAIAHYRLFITRNACLAQNLDPERFRYRHV